jgi:hypothetical protein
VQKISKNTNSTIRTMNLAIVHRIIHKSEHKAVANSCNINGHDRPDTCRNYQNLNHNNKKITDITSNRNMCNYHIARHAGCRCTADVYRIPCELHYHFTTRCNYYAFTSELMEGYCPRHSKEILETGGDDWPYGACD